MLSGLSFFLSDSSAENVKSQSFPPEVVFKCLASFGINGNSSGVTCACGTQTPWRVMPPRIFLRMVQQLSAIRQRKERDDYIWSCFGRASKVRPFQFVPMFRDGHRKSGVGASVGACVTKVRQLVHVQAAVQKSCPRGSPFPKFHLNNFASFKLIVERKTIHSRARLRGDDQVLALMRLWHL